MRVVVTGGAGFVGSHVLEVLIERGHRGVCIDRDPCPIAEVEHVIADLFNSDAQAFRGAEAIIHCAAYADISRNWRGKSERYRILHDNVMLTTEVLEHTTQCPFVFVSSACVYGSQTIGSPRRCEADQTCASSPYAASKLAGEAYTEAYAHAYGHDSYVARLVSCVGPRYRHGHIADFVRMAREGAVRVLDNGRQSKSYVHVRDAAEALVDLACGDQHVGRRFSPGIYNVTSDQVWSVRQTIEMMGVEATYGLTPVGWVGDPSNLRVSANKRVPGKRSVAMGVQEALEGLGWAR